MKQKGLISVMTLVLILLASAAAYAEEGRIAVNINGFKNDNGAAYIALVNTKESYLSMKVKPFMGAKTKITGNRTSYTFENVPYGDYAIKVYHDENGNGELDKTSMGVPTEEYGFSNNVRSSFGQPKFEKAKFTLGSPNMTISITVK